MIRSADQRIVALLPVRRDRHDALAEPFGATTVLGHTIARLSRCEGLDRIVLLHDHDADPPALPDTVDTSRVRRQPVVAPLDDERRPERLAARRWAPTGWRGGLGAATCYDEPLAPAAMAEALDAAGAAAGLIVSPDWPLVDPALCDAVIERHHEQPEKLKLVFTQAPPGLAGCLIDRSLIHELRDKGAMLGSFLDYQPHLPQLDPISRDPCVQTPRQVRTAGLRATFDAPRWQRLLRRIEQQLGPENLITADAGSIAATAQPMLPGVHHPLPQQATVEVNTDRAATGPAVPQAHTALDRPPMSVDRARQLFEQLAAEPDVAVTIGGLGDPLLHPEWEQILDAAEQAGLNGVHVETDLLVDQPVLRRLLDRPIDVISVRLNADSPETYRALMGRDDYRTAIKNIEWLLNHRSEAGRPGLPWIVPRMVKTPDNVHELETFFDRWMHHCRHAVIEPPTTGDGSMPDQAVIDMAPPRRVPCRQIQHRLTIHSDGRAALCDQDWHGRQAIGGLDTHTAGDLWAAMDETRQSHRAGRFDTLPMCAGCRQWHRP